ncbi:pentatricopeptide repeat-containing protein At4g02750 [Selaginella moellendorffii]|nr:pentatricopeptide repeat-containing protein At4g02750 [Selaginella moellendorffii]|eukprot:XP_002964582.2 pentatricopeptide repeat-containing protein At4g02750 [Selaginella moellendorffii]
MTIGYDPARMGKQRRKIETGSSFRGSARRGDPPLRQIQGPSRWQANPRRARQAGAGWINVSGESPRPDNGHFGDAKKIFERMPERDSVSWNLMITSFAQKGWVREAREVFDQTPDHDTVTWNAMIAAYAQNGYSQQAINLFRLMQIEGVAADRITFTTAIEACAGCLAWASLGRIIHAEVASSGVLLDRKVHNSLINLYGKAGQAIEAASVFHSMAGRDVISWTALMMSFSQHGHLSQASSVFDRMPQHDNLAWNALIIDFARIGDLSSAMRLYNLLPEESPVSSTTMIAAFAQNGHLQGARDVFHALADPDVVAWNAIIAAAVQHSSFREALELFRAMVASGASPNRITFISSLHACAREAVLDAGKAIHEEISIRGLAADATLAAMLINVYGRCGHVATARKLFDDLPELCVLLWNTMLAAYAHAGHSAAALELFQDMNLAGFHADPVSFTVLLSACSHAGELRDALRCFATMVGDHGIVPERDHFGCVVDLMGRTGQLEKAEDLVANMPFEPDFVSLTSLVGACRVHRDPRRGRRISELALASSPKRSSAYALLSSLFAQDHEVDESKSLLLVEETIDHSFFEYKQVLIAN